MKILAIIFVLFALVSSGSAQEFGSGQEKIAINNWPGTQPVSFTTPISVTGTFWQSTQPVSFLDVIHVIADSIPSITFSSTQPVEINDEVPVRVSTIGTTTVSGTVAVSGLSGTSAVEVDDEIPVRVNQIGTATVAGTVAVSGLSGTSAVEIDDESPVRVQQTGTANVRVVSTAVPTVRRYPEIILPTACDGVSVTVALAHTPVKWTLTDLHDTAPVFFSKGGAAATTADYKLMPGQSITGEDEEKLFSVYSTDETTPPTFQIFAVYEVSL